MKQEGTSVITLKDDCQSSSRLHSFQNFHEQEEMELLKSRCGVVFLWNIYGPITDACVGNNKLVRV